MLECQRGWCGGGIGNGAALRGIGAGAAQSGECLTEAVEIEGGGIRDIRGTDVDDGSGGEDAACGKSQGAAYE